MKPADAVCCPKCSRMIAIEHDASPVAVCEHCGHSVNRPRSASEEAPPAEKLFYPPGFGRSKSPAVINPAPAKESPKSDATPSSDRYPPGHPKANKPRKEIAESENQSRDPAPPREASRSLTASLVGAPEQDAEAVSAASPDALLPPGAEEIEVPLPPPAAEKIDDLLPQAVEAAPPVPPAVAVPPTVAIPPPGVRAPANPGLPTVSDDFTRQTGQARGQRRMIGNLIIWGVCTVLLCLMLWFLLNR